jgi:pSer/pThr/pTyr-binding forkhead associated (FHA) protein
MDNNVVLYSAVVSRRHLEIRKNGSEWELENLGANGTFFEGKPIQKKWVDDGMIVRLASSGPQIQITIKQASTGLQLPSAVQSLSPPLEEDLEPDSPTVRQSSDKHLLSDCCPLN